MTSHSFNMRGNKRRQAAQSEVLQEHLKGVGCPSPESQSIRIPFLPVTINISYVAIRPRPAGV